MKKFLSLVLALVMTMSLVTVSAGAKDFTDADKTTYGEAVDVISTIGVVDGYSDGSFNPSATLTRGAAAKIICNLILGPTTASALSADAAPFKDVPTSNTFAGYIAYCAQKGIISGYNDGTFRPAATLTSYAFMKMLLGALGYDQTIEGYTGANWSIQVAKQALNIGLDDGLEGEFVGTKPVTREEAALYAFNMLQATMVEYDSKTTVNVNGATVTVAGDKAKEVAQGSYDNNMNKDNLQFAEKYFGKLDKVEATDDFARPATKWNWKGVKVGTYADKADATYSANVKLGQIYADLDMSDKDEAAPVFVDGVKAADAAKVSKGNDTKIADLTFAGSTKCSVGNGTKVEAFRDKDTNEVTIVAINTYVAEVNKVVGETNSKDAYITLSALSGNARATDEFETEAFEVDEVVLYTYANKEIQSVKKAESVEGAVTKIVDGKSINLGDTTYKYSKNYDLDNGVSIDSEYTVYLDEYGYAIYVEESEYTIQDYAFLQAVQGSSNAFDSDRAALLTYEGKKKTVDTNKDYLADFYASAKIGEAAAKIVLFKENSDGEYRLKALKTENYTDAGNFEMTNGNAKITLGAGTTAGTDYIYANSKTVFVVGTHAGSANPTYRSYTGVNNAPSIEKKDASIADALDMSYYCRSGNVATIVFIDVDTTEYNVTAGNQQIVFFAVESGSKKTEDKDNEYYTYNAVVDGKIVEGVKVDADVKIDGTTASGKFEYANPVANSVIVFNGVSYDDGIMTDLNKVAAGDFGTVKGTDKLDGDYNIELGGKTFVVDTDCKVFFVDDDGKISEGTIKQVRRSDKDIATYVLEDGQVTYLFIQQYFENNDQSNGVSGVKFNSYNAGSNKVKIDLNNVEEDAEVSVTVEQLRDNGYVEVGTVSGVVSAADVTNGYIEITLPVSTGNTYRISGAFGSQIIVD